MRKLPAFALAGVAAAVLGGSALAASRNNHVMTVALPDGSTARVEYVGNVAPKLVIEPPRAAVFGDWAPLPAFVGFDRMIEQMNRQAEAMMRQVQQTAGQPAPGVAAPNFASFGNAPGGFTSTTIVSYSNGKSTCTRSTETVSQGAGKPPTVRSTVSGNCGPQRAPETAPDSPRLNNT